MEFTLITVAVVVAVNFYLFLFGGLTSAIVIGSGALIIGILMGRLIERFDNWEDYEYDDYDDEDYEYDYDYEEEDKHEA
mgnify:CR=1 FL=1